MSPWVDIDQAVANVGNRYVFSYKPNPAVFAEENWHLDKARQELETVLTKAKANGCVVELIMKDISTLRYQPQRLWEWAAMATEVTKRYGE
jgi:ABC-type xylose transport system substrate-binding protein